MKNLDLTQFDIVDTTGVKVIKSDIERPATDGFETRRGFCVNLPYNEGLLNKLQVVVDNIKADCKDSFFEETFDVIDNLDDLKRLLTEVIIRFDTAPDYYTNSDTKRLLKQHNQI